MAATEKGVWNLQEVRDKQLASEWTYDGESQLTTWGENYRGILGLNNEVDLSSPTQLPGTTWNKLIQGNSAFFGNFGTKTDGTLWSWGYNDRGQLGDNSTVQRSSPIQVGTDTTWSFAGTCRGYTSNSNGVKTNGTLWSWGYNIFGPLGLNQANPVNISSPTQVPGTTWSTDESKMGRGFYHNHAIKTDGTLWAWGWNNKGQLGLNNTTIRSSPMQVGTNTTWASLSHYASSSTAIKTDGTLWAWGYNLYGELGLNQQSPTGYSSPIQVGTNTTWSKIAITGSAHAIKTDGTLWSWGYNRYGSLGLNAGNLVKLSSPTQVGTDATWSEIKSVGTNMAAGGNTLALKTDGTLWSWGYGTGAGTLGQNEAKGYSSPVQIPGTWTSIFATKSAFGFKQL